MGNLEYEHSDVDYSLVFYDRLYIFRKKHKLTVLLGIFSIQWSYSSD